MQSVAGIGFYRILAFAKPGTATVPGVITRLTIVRYTIPILFLLLVQAAKAQPNDLNFINFSSNNGLSSNIVNAICKDKTGYMWFATDDGLNKFDGTNFTVYNHKTADSTSIGANHVWAIHEDPSGNLWAGTGRTLSLYDKKKDCFHNYNIANGATVRSICSDKAGHLWVATFDGLFQYNPKTGRAKQYKADSANPRQLITNTIICVFVDSRQRLWVGTNAGLYLYQPATDDFKHFAYSLTNPASISDNIIKAIAEDKEGRLWLGTSDGGLNMLQPNGTSFTRYKTSNTDPGTISSNRIYSIVPDDTGKFWLGTEEGLTIFDPQTGKAQRITGNGRNKYSLEGKSIRSIFIDKLGIYWVGTFQDGVNKYDKNLPFFNLVQSNSFDPLGLSAPKVSSFAEGDNGDLYIGTDGGGLNLYHRKTGLFQHFNIPGSNKGQGLPILALERVGDEIWIGAYLQGIYTLNTKNGSIRHFTKEAAPGHLSSNEIFCIKKDRQGNVWIGTNGNGVDVYDPRSAQFHRLSNVMVEDGENKLLTSGFIRAIEEDSAGNMWIGSIGGGIVCYNPIQKNTRAFNRHNTQLPLEEVQTLHIQQNGTIWAGTPGNGLCKLDEKNNRFTVYTEQEGLANNVIYKILEDDAGMLWFSTSKGISRFNPLTGACKNYTYHNGLQQSTFVLEAGLKTASGELFFGGLKGFNYFRPNTLHNNRNVPTVVFTGLKIANQTVIPGKNAAIQEQIGVAGEIRLSYKQNFSVDFVALDYTTPGETQYLYKLDGFDHAWNQVGASRTAVFTNLYPGHYTLQVRAKNSNDEWITAPASIAIYVKPPFWLTGYAYVLYIILIGLLLGAIRYRGIRKLKNRFALEQERLQMKQMVEQERREAERLHEFDQARIRFLTNLSHEFRTPISLIMGPIENLQEKEADSGKAEQLKMVKRNARRLLNLVNQLLDFRKLEEQELKLNATEGDIVAFVREVSDSFRDMAERKQIHFVFTSEMPAYRTSFDRDKMERILFNLLGNAFKFTAKDGQVSLEIRQSLPSKELQIVIADTGIGMREEDRQHIFDRFFQGNVHTSIMNQGSGIGLSITKEFTRLHGGTIQVESTPGKGSIFTVQLPLENIPEGEKDTPLPEDNKLPEIPEFEKLTVLLVEDNDDFRSYLKENLRHFYKIIEAADGKEGWQKALSAHPDVIVSDISMPQMDGIELSRKIKSDKRTHHIPIILLTALTGDAYQLKGLETGASDYLTKPFSSDILAVKIRNLVLLNQQLKETYTRRLNIETPGIEVQSDDEKLLLKITQYIESTLESQQLSVEELSKYVFMSRSSLYRKIVDLTGETPVEFIRSVKLNKAAELLEKSDMKITEVGYAVGFTTPNYFARAFKAKFNLSPSEYVALKKKPAN